MKHEHFITRDQFIKMVPELIRYQCIPENYFEQQYQEHQYGSLHELQANTLAMKNNVKTNYRETPAQEESSTPLMLNTGKTVIDDFLIIHHEYESSDDSMEDEVVEYVHQQIQKEAGHVNLNKAGYEEDYTPYYPRSKVDYDLNGHDYHDLTQNKNGFVQSSTVRYREEYPYNKMVKEQSFKNGGECLQEPQDKTSSPSDGPFYTIKISKESKENDDDYIQAQREETAQLCNGILRAYNEELAHSFEHNYDPYGSNKFRKNNGATEYDQYSALRQEALIPSAERINIDMRAAEKKYYERYLSEGYKPCECDACETLELRFLIKNERDPADYKNLHQNYLKEKIQTEKIKKVNNLYQNHTIIIVRNVE